MAPPEKAQKPRSKKVRQSLVEITTMRDGSAGGQDLQAIIDAVPDPVAVYDPALRLVKSNAAHRATVRRFYPQVPPADLYERAHMTQTVFFDAAGAPALQEQWPQQRILRGETLSGPTAVEARAATLLGETQWWSVTGAPLRAGDGSVTGAVVVFADITARKQAEAELLRVNERFQLAERAANGFIYEWDVRSGQIYRSEGVERMLGYRAGDIPLTWTAWAQLVYPGDWQATTDAEELAYLEALPGETLENVYRIRHRDGHYLTVADYALIERDVAGHIVRLIGQTQDITERKQAEEALQRAHDELEQRVAERTRELDNANKELRRLSQRILEVQESERHLIARELHDEIGQQLTGIKMLLETLEESVPDIPSPAGADTSLDKSLDGSLYAPSLSEISAAVAMTLERVRDLSLDLRPAVLDSLGLLPALQWQFERYTRLTGISVDFSADGLDHRLPVRLEAGAYRLIQEALTNVARHAGVSEVTVQIYVSEKTLSLYVVDGGPGFDVEETLAAGHSTGLTGMRERADLLDGTLTIDSLPGEGTTVHADLPITRAFEMDAVHETDEDFAYTDWRTPADGAARHHARDDLRNRARDKYRDSSRDARRDTLRDAMRDMTRDTTRDVARDTSQTSGLSERKESHDERRAGG